MFGMSLTEILFILAIVLVFLGPEKIPEAARFVGKMLREVRKASNLLRDAVMIDEKPRRIRPAAQNRPLTEELDEEDLYDDDEYPRDPDPRRDLRVVEMRSRVRPEGLSEIALAAMQNDVRHREVYLHVPYDETI